MTPIEMNFTIIKLTDGGYLIRIGENNIAARSSLGEAIAWMRERMENVFSEQPPPMPIAEGGDVPKVVSDMKPANGNGSLMGRMKSAVGSLA